MVCYGDNEHRNDMTCQHCYIGFGVKIATSEESWCGRGRSERRKKIRGKFDARYDIHDMYHEYNVFIEYIVFMIASDTSSVARAC